MIVFPAIDIYGGQAVRLAQGDYSRVTVYHEDPLAQALEWVEQGAQALHIVDLDGAKTGTPHNIAHVSRIASELNIPVQVGGGVRTLDIAEQLLAAGVSRVVLGTKLATDDAFVRAAVESFGSERIVAGIDAKAMKVATAGWIEETHIEALDLVRNLSQLGIRHLVFTDIARDGMQTGFDPDAYRAIAGAAGFPVIISGGVATLQDFSAAALLGGDIVEGVISGKALYEKVFTLAQATARLEGGN